MATLIRRRAAYRFRAGDAPTARCRCRIRSWRPASSGLPPSSAVVGVTRSPRSPRPAAARCSSRPIRSKTPIDADTLAQVYPLADDQSRVDTVVVVVNLELLQKLSGLPVTAVDFEDDVDRILAHEVYGHAIPLLLAGSLAGNCADPAIGQSAIASCAIQRENVIRREMRLGQRFEYGRDSLALARRYWQ